MATNLKKTDDNTLAMFELPALSTNLKELVAEELDGLGTIPFDVVKFPSGGGLVFEVPTEDPDQPDTVKDITGVILFHHPTNAYWEKDISESENKNPDCVSYDGHVGVKAATGEACDCADCPLNQYGTAKKGSGKACKNAHRIFLLRSGDPLPMIINIPPTSLKEMKRYFVKSVVARGQKSFQVITRITLKKAQNADGISYSTAVFTRVGDIPTEQLPQIIALSNTIKEISKQIQIVNDDAAEPTEPVSYVAPDNLPPDFTDIKDEELPV